MVYWSIVLKSESELPDPRSHPPLRTRSLCFHPSSTESQSRLEMQLRSSLRDLGNK